MERQRTKENTHRSGSDAQAAEAARQHRLDTTADKLDMIPVIEEHVRVSKKVIESGRIHLHKEVHEEEVMVDIPLTEEEVEIERVPINKFVDEAPQAVRYEGDTMIVPVLKEVVVKRLVLVEEMRVTKRRRKTQETHPLTLRKEEVRIEREGGPASTPSGSENQA